MGQGWSGRAAGFTPRRALLSVFGGTSSPRTFRDNNAHLTKIADGTMSIRKRWPQPHGASMDVPWWEATAASVVRGSRPDATDAGETSAAGSFGCDVRGAGGHRRRGGAAHRQAIGATGSAPSFAADASALRAFVASSPRLCVNISATWCAPCVRFHPKFADMSAAFPDVNFVTVDIDALDDDVLDELNVETIPTFLLMRGGREVTRVVGVTHKRPARPLAAAIRRHLCS